MSAPVTAPHLPADSNRTPAPPRRAERGSAQRRVALPVVGGDEHIAAAGRQLLMRRLTSSSTPASVLLHRFANIDAARKGDAVAERGLDRSQVAGRRLQWVRHVGAALDKARQAGRNRAVRVIDNLDVWRFGFDTMDQPGVVFRVQDYHAWGVEKSCHLWHNKQCFGK